MAKRRIFVVFFMFMILFCFLLATSSFFKIKSVEVCFFDKNNNKIDIKTNLIYTSKAEIENLTEVAKLDFGTSIFLIKTDKYFEDFEFKNPCAKLLSVYRVYPNKLVFNVYERKPCYYILSNKNYYILDEEFKILKITDQAPQKLIEICAMSYYGQEIDFFELFQILPSAFNEGQFLTENNLLLKSMVNTKNVLDQFELQSMDVVKLCIQDNYGIANIIFSTGPNYGVNFKIENVLNSYNKKLSLVLGEFQKALIDNEQLKLSFGEFFVDDSFNVVWNNL
ncbi:MAG: hypothetical protein IJD48_02145 [Clostridia bacterium]|nr:hypothetical protein [Clostridia bacterium]